MTYVDCKVNSRVLWNLHRLPYPRVILGHQLQPASSRKWPISKAVLALILVCLRPVTRSPVQAGSISARRIAHGLESFEYLDILRPWIYTSIWASIIMGFLSTWISVNLRRGFRCRGRESWPHASRIPDLWRAKAGQTGFRILRISTGNSLLSQLQFVDADQVQMDAICSYQCRDRFGAFGLYSSTQCESLGGCSQTTFPARG